MQEEKQAVYGIVFNEGKTEILLVKRRDIPVWVLPGGGLEPGETPEEGTIRELLEETGLTTVVVRKVAEYLPVNRLTQLTHLFECQATAGRIQSSQETLDVRFFPLNALPLLPPPYENWIADSIANHPYMLRKKIEGVSYLVLLKLFIKYPILVARYLLTLIGIHVHTKNTH